MFEFLDDRERFANRAEAGRRLADRLGHLQGERPVVGAQPRGGGAGGLEIAPARGAGPPVVRGGTKSKK